MPSSDKLKGVLFFLLLFPMLLNAKNIQVKNNDFSELLNTPKSQVNQIIFYESDPAYLSPEEWGKFIYCERVYFRNSTISHFPVGLTFLPYLQILEFNTDNLTFISKDLERLQFLQTLEFSTDKTELILEVSLAEFPRLKRLKFHASNILTIPPALLKTRTIRDLHLYLPDVTVFPIEIYEIFSLKEIELQLYNVGNFPEGIGNLLELEKLKVEFGNEGPKKIPEDFSNLLGLIDLELHLSSVRQLPPNFEYLVNLKNLELIMRELETLPEDFAFLTNLKWFHLSSENLKELPPKFNELPLRYIKLNTKHLHNFEGTYSHTKVLELRNPFYEKVPFSTLDLRVFTAVNTLEIDMELDSAEVLLPKENVIKRIVMKSCGIVAIPASFKFLKQCETIDLDINKCTSLPDFIFELPKLKSLKMSGNPIKKELIEVYKRKAGFGISKYY